MSYAEVIAMKVCYDCGVEKPSDEFPIALKRKDGLGSRCKECQRVYSRAWYRKNRAKKSETARTYYQENEVRFRENAYRRKYGITILQYEGLLEAQEGCCAICGKPEEKRRLSVDHCHKTGQVRGLLCRQCNYSLGCWGDDLEGVMRVVHYLERSGEAHECNRCRY